MNSATSRSLISIIAVLVVAGLFFTYHVSAFVYPPDLRLAIGATCDCVSMTIPGHMRSTEDIIIEDSAVHEGKAIAHIVKVPNGNIWLLATLHHASVRMCGAVHLYTTNILETEERLIGIFVFAQIHSNLNVRLPPWRLTYILDNDMANGAKAVANKLLNARWSDGNVGPLLTFVGSAGFLKSSVNEENTHAGDDDRRGGRPKYGDSPEVHPLLSGKVALGCLGFVGGLYYFISAFGQRGRRHVGTGAGYALMGAVGILFGGLLCLMGVLGV